MWCNFWNVLLIWSRLCWCFGHEPPDSCVEWRRLAVSTQRLTDTSLHYTVNFPLRQNHTICHADLWSEKAVVKVCMNHQRHPNSPAVLRRGRARGCSGSQAMFILRLWGPGQSLWKKVLWSHENLTENQTVKHGSGSITFTITLGLLLLWLISSLPGHFWWTTFSHRQDRVYAVTLYILYKFRGFLNHQTEWYFPRTWTGLDPLHDAVCLSRYAH